MAKEDVFDPQTRRPSGKGGGQFLDKVTRHMLDTRLQADTLGESKDAKELAKMGLLTGMDTGTVQAYATQAINLIRKYNTSAADLKHVMPLLDEIENNAKADLTLSELERNHILQIVRKLRTFAASKLRLNNKIGAKLKGVVRAKTQQWKESLGENLSSSPSALFRLAGKALGAGREEEGPSRAEGESKGAIAKAAALFARRQGKTANSPALRERGRGSASLSVWDEDEDDDLVSMSPGRVRSAGTGAAAGGGGALGGAAGATLSKILTTDNQILSEVKGVKATLVAAKEQDAEQYELDDKARERAADNAKEQKKDDLFGRLAALFGGKKKGSGEAAPTGGIFDTIGDMLKTALAVKLLPLVEAVFASIKAAAMATLSGLSTFVGATLVPGMVLAAQAALAEHLAGIFNDIMDQYPALMRGDKTAKDDVQAAVDLKKNTAAVLDKSRPQLEPKGGFITEDELAESRQLGLNPGAYKKQKGTKYAARMAQQAKDVAAKPITTQETAAATASAPEAVSLAPLRLQEKLSSVGPTTTPSRTPSRGPGKKAGEALMLAAAEEQGITDPTEQAALLSQTAHESANFTAMVEKGSPEYFQKYEGRKNLGNTEPGDGFKFRGRGFIQLTGRYNYAKYGKAVGVDLVNNPDLAADPKVAAKIAVAYWKGSVRPKVKDMANVRDVTRAVQGGEGGLASRTEQFAARMTPPSPRGARSGMQLASATVAAGGGRSAGTAPTVIVTPSAPVVMAHQQAPTAIPIPIRVDNLDATVRAIRNISGTVLG